MIFVTVGTHEQQFNRLIRCVDELKETGVFDDEVIMQTGYSTYSPQYCEWEKLYPYERMAELIKEARIVITHGGPSSFVPVIQENRVPVVVPRQKKYGEHVNDHQIWFCESVKQKTGQIIVVKDVTKLAEIIVNYDSYSHMTRSDSYHNEAFVKRFGRMIDSLMGY